MIKINIINKTWINKMKNLFYHLYYQETLFLKDESILI